jgi:hypothetical protein
VDTALNWGVVSGITIKGQVGWVRQRVVRTLRQFGSGAVYGVHNASMVNLMRGVTERVLYVQEGGLLQPPRKPDGYGFKRLAAIRSQLLQHLSPTTVVPRDQYPGLYSGRKQLVYQRAYEGLLSRPISRKDAYVSTFIKAEKVNFSAKGDPAPRVIQPRSPRYNLEVGRYLKLFEAELVHGFERLRGYNVILKGLNADRVASHYALTGILILIQLLLDSMPPDLTNMSVVRRWSSNTLYTMPCFGPRSCVNYSSGSWRTKVSGGSGRHYLRTS